MRRFFHRKGSASRQGSLSSANGGQATNRLLGTPTSVSPRHGPSPITGRVRAPALRSRSMSVLYGPESETGRSKRFTRSLSFSDDQATVSNNNRKLLTQLEEDEVFQTYTKKLYVMFAALCAVITGFVVYAYVYNTGGNKT